MGSSEQVPVWNWVASYLSINFDFATKVHCISSSQTLYFYFESNFGVVLFSFSLFFLIFNENCGFASRKPCFMLCGLFTRTDSYSVTLLADLVLHFMKVLICVKFFVNLHVCTFLFLWKSENGLQESTCFFHHIVGTLNQSTRFSSRLFLALSHSLALKSSVNVIC